MTSRRVTTDGPPARSSALLRNSGWNSLSQLAPVLVNVALTPYVLSGLGLARFGLFVLALTIADFLLTVDGGLYASAQRYFAVYMGRGDRRATTRLLCTLLVLALSAGGALCAVFYAVSAGTLALFDIPEELSAEGTYLMRMLALVILLSVIRGVFAAVLNADGRFALTSVVTIIQYGVYTVGVIITLVDDRGLYGMAWTLVAQTAVATLLMAGPALRYLDGSSIGLQSRAELREFLRFAGQAQVAGLSELINTQADALIIAGALDVRRVGLFSAGSTFAGQLRRLPTNALAPAAAQLGQVFGERGLAAATEEFARLQRHWVQFCTGWMGVAAASAYFGVTAWLGEEFRLSAIVAVVLLLGQLVRLWTGLLLVYCQTIGRADIEARYGVVSVVLNLALTAALVLPFGVLGVVAATAVAQVGGCVYLLAAVRRRISVPVPTFLPDVPWAPAVLAAAVAVVGELLVRPLGVEGPLGLIVAGAAAAPGLILFAVLLLGPRQAAAHVRRGVLALRRTPAAPSDGTVPDAAAADAVLEQELAVAAHAGTVDPLTQADSAPAAVADPVRRAGPAQAEPADKGALPSRAAEDERQPRSRRPGAAGST